MVYLKTENEMGVITFTPLNDESIYVLCKHCGKMVQIKDPGGIAWEAGSFQELDICEECNDMLLELEEEKRFDEHIKRMVDTFRASGIIK